MIYLSSDAVSRMGPCLQCLDRNRIEKLTYSHDSSVLHVLLRLMDLIAVPTVPHLPSRSISHFLLDDLDFKRLLSTTSHMRALIMDSEKV